MLSKSAFALLVIALSASIARAQQLHGPAFHIPVPVAANSSSFRGPATHFRRAGRGFAAPFVYSDYPFFDYPAGPAAEAVPPQVIFVQVPSAAPPATPEAKIEPLLIELRGDHYVRVGADGKNQTEPAGEPSAVSRQLLKQTEAASAVLPPVVLVYRDGRREEIRDYTIADGFIYARGDYYTDGYWNKKIQLAALDLPATTKASQGRGAQFVLPSSPNEVITRP